MTDARSWSPGDGHPLPPADPAGSPSYSVPIEAPATRQEARRQRRAEHRATQVIYPWRSAIGAGIATLTAILVTVAAVSPLIGPFVDRYVPGAGAGVVGFGLFCGGLAVLLKRIANLPAVTDLLVRLGIGPIPKS